MIYKLLFPFACILAGCASTGTVAPMGEGRYMLYKQAATGFSGLGNLKSEVLTEANAYCTKMGKRLEVTGTSETPGPYILGNYPRAEVQFSCV